MQAGRERAVRGGSPLACLGAARDFHHGLVGFTLVEVLVAAGLLIVGLGALADLGVVSIRAGLLTRTMTYTATLASQKVEELRAGSGLVPSPSGTLLANTAGYVDHLDGLGRVVGVSSQPPRDASFTRRWSVEPWPGDPGRLLVLRVVAMSRADATADSAVAVRLGSAGLVTLVALGPR